MRKNTPNSPKKLDSMGNTQHMLIIIYVYKQTVSHKAGIKCTYTDECRFQDSIAEPRYNTSEHRGDHEAGHRIWYTICSTSWSHFVTMSMIALSYEKRHPPKNFNLVTKW